MNLDTFFAVASPSTLASLVGDIDRRPQEPDAATLELRTLTWRTLCDLIGEGDALQLVLDGMVDRNLAEEDVVD